MSGRSASSTSNNLDRQLLLTCARLLAESGKLDEVIRKQLRKLADSKEEIMLLTGECKADSAIVAKGHLVFFGCPDIPVRFQAGGDVVLVHCPSHKGGHAGGTMWVDAVSSKHYLSAGLDVCVSFPNMEEVPILEYWGGSTAGTIRVDRSLVLHNHSCPRVESSDPTATLWLSGTSKVAEISGFAKVIYISASAAAPQPRSSSAPALLGGNNGHKRTRLEIPSDTDSEEGEEKMGDRDCESTDGSSSTGKRANKRPRVEAE